MTTITAYKMKHALLTHLRAYHDKEHTETFWSTGILKLERQAKHRASLKNTHLRKGSWSHNDRKYRNGISRQLVTKWTLVGGLVS